jgi:Ribbon-helix-helix protein, copG family
MFRELYYWRGRNSMADRIPMTLNLTQAEMDALESLAKQKDLSKTAILRQALRLYQLAVARWAEGGKLFFEHEAKREKAELMLL